MRIGTRTSKTAKIYYYKNNKMQITSLQNSRVKYLVKLREDRRQRQADGLILVEGVDEIAMAITSGHMAQTLITCPELVRRPLAVSAAETLLVTASVFEKLSYRENPDGWIAVFPMPSRSPRDVRLGERPLVIVAESVEKPGNLGAILRTADAAGVDALLVCDPRVDLYNPNVIRASRGTVFSVPAVEISNADALEYLRGNGLRILAATPAGQVHYTHADLGGPLAILVGTEDQGLTDFWLDHADVRVQIPMYGKVNSLNVSIATALIVYEVLRQRGV
jgi:TrmH family RNA methyltransferase